MAISSVGCRADGRVRPHGLSGRRPGMSACMRDPARWLRQIAALLAIALVARPAAQELTLERAVNRLHEYLETYEVALSEVVADEIYDQRTTRPGPRRPVQMDSTGLPIPDPAPAAIDTTARRLQSTISFMRLPGGAAWLGLRT